MSTFLTMLFFLLCCYGLFVLFFRLIKCALKGLCGILNYVLSGQTTPAKTPAKVKPQTQDSPGDEKARTLAERQIGEILQKKIF